MCAIYSIKHSDSINSIHMLDLYHSYPIEIDFLIFLIHFGAVLVTYIFRFVDYGNI